MPKWLSSTLIVIGFLALIALALLPRNVIVTVTTTTDHSVNMEAGDSIHAAPEGSANEIGEDD